MQYFVVIALMVGFCSCKNLPDYIKVCKSRPVENCILENIEIVRPKLKDGVPELGLPKFNPILVKEAEVDVGNRLHVKVRDVKVWKADKFIVDDIKAGLDDITFDIKLRLAEVAASFQYNAVGQLLILKVNASGEGNINITDLSATIRGEGETQKKNGKTYYHMNTLTINPKVGNMHIKIENLFTKNPEITENANKLLNENQAALYEDFGPIVVDIVKKLATDIIHKFCAKFPVEVLFPGE